MATDNSAKLSQRTVNAAIEPHGHYRRLATPWIRREEVEEARTKKTAKKKKKEEEKKAIIVKASYYECQCALSENMAAPHLLRR